jgi:hypothetical protein
MHSAQAAVHSRPRRAPATAPERRIQHGGGAARRVLHRPVDGVITDWSWDFGDGQTSTDRNPTHTYATPGLYDFTLTVTGPRR